MLTQLTQDTYNSLDALTVTDGRWFKYSEDGNGRLYVFEPDDDESTTHAVTIVTTLWERPWSVPFFLAHDPPARRIILAPAKPPLNKLEVYKTFSAQFLPLCPTGTAIFADADVLLGQNDYLKLVAAVPTILTGGPEVVGTFHAFVSDVLEHVLGAPPFDGWGYEDLWLLYRLHHPVPGASPKVPSFVRVTDSLAVAHAPTLRQEASDGSGPGIAARRNYELFRAAVTAPWMADMLYLHSSRQWRHDQPPSTEVVA